MQLRKCSKCECEKALSEFYIRQSGKDIGKVVPQCKKCTSERVSKNSSIRRQRRKRHIDAWKLRHGCSNCGYSKHSAALDLHHVDGKEGAVSYFMESTTIKRLFNEIRKCVILCANCHRVHHAEEET